MQPRARPRVFLDSNVIFSGLYSAEGAPGIILRHFVEGRIRVVISQQVLEEVVRTIKEKLPEALPVLRKLLVSTPPEIRKDPTPGEVSYWTEVVQSEDAPILAAALAAQPDCLVTGDKHFLENPIIMEKSGLHIVTPAQFLKDLEKQSE